MPCIGLITTGHGPRQEYIDFHRGVMRALGYEVEIVAEHLLDGLGWADIAPHTSGPEEHVLGAYVRADGAEGPKMPNGAVHAYLRRDWAAERVQLCIDRLVARGADVIVLCASAPFPKGVFKSPVPLLKPAEIVANTVKELADHSKERLRIALLTTAGHGEKDLQHWQELDFADGLDIVNVVFETDVLAAARRLTDERFDLAVIWSYGWGLTSTGEVSLSAELEEILGCPVLMPHRATAMIVAALVRCGFDDRRFAA